jgi:FtsZ-binding cell division protein ZapB
MADIVSLEQRLLRLDKALHKCERKIKEQADTIHELRTELKETNERMEKMTQTFQEWQQIMRCMIPEVTKRIHS